MFTREERDTVRQRVIELAKSDPRVTAGALTGSMALEPGDSWSDIDVAFGIVDGIRPETVLDEWTQVLTTELGVLDYWDLPAGSSIYRVFLLPSGLEIDVAVTPASDFGARGPNFHLLFGASQPIPFISQPDAHHLIGLCWHHVLHANSSIERKKPWRAEYWISEIRHHSLALACIRLGENAHYARGIDQLPATVTNPLADTLVRSLDEAELRRALVAVTKCFISELEQHNPALCARLSPLLLEFGTGM